MNTIVMNTGNEASMLEQYGEEVMCAGWNPQLTLMGDSAFTQTNKHANLPADLASVDVDAFLKKMYEYQR